MKDSLCGSLNAAGREGAYREATQPARALQKDQKILCVQSCAQSLQLAGTLD